MMEPTWTSDCGTVKLWLGDCLEVMQTWPDGAVDAVVTDPPYGIGVNEDGCKKHINPKFTNRIIGDDVPFDPSPFLSFRSGVIWGATCFYDRLPAGQIAWLAWDRTTRNGLKLRNTEWEAAFAWPLRRPQMFRFMWQGAFRDGDRGGSSSHIHPTQKPVELMEWCIGFTKGQTIADPFMGSGTTGVAAVRLSRQFWGVEIDPEYFEVAKRRIKDELRRVEFLEGNSDGRPRQLTMLEETA